MMVSFHLELAHRLAGVSLAADPIAVFQIEELLNGCRKRSRHTPSVDGAAIADVTQNTVASIICMAGNNGTTGIVPVGCRMVAGGGGG